MRKLISLHWLPIVIAFMLVAVNPAMVFADAASTTAAPVGYILNSVSGLWENGTYAWDPATGQTRPLTSSDYSYNPTTGHWDTTAYAYDPITGTYVPNVPGPTAPTGGDTSQQGPTTTPGSTLSTSQNTPTTPTDTPTTTDPTPSATGLSTPLDMSSPSHLFDSFYNASISNRLISIATTGNSTVSGNTTAGSATTGNAMTIANLINLLQSSWTSSGGAPMTFMANIVGNVVGDLTIDPSQINQPTTTSPSPANTVINNTSNGQINNTLNLTANSGNATVDSNTSAGNATTGDATVLANLINAINSSISSGQSFIGIINILGNLNGDILLPQGLIDQILATNQTSNSIISTVPTQLSVNNTDNQSITNTISTNASSGTAAVSNNTSAGNAATGDAITNITLLNLTGRQIIDSNTLLVFVNVLGHWVGLIMDAPSGTTAAALGGGVQSSTTIPSNLALTNTSNSNITNQLNAEATTGDASVTNNTKAGNATTGNASIGVNILNITGSEFSSMNWFGVLFINVLGEWTGSFGVNTSAGDQPSAEGTRSTSSTPATQNRPAARVFGFVPRANTRISTYETDWSTSNIVTPPDNAVLSASAILTPHTANRQPDNNASTQPKDDGWILLLVVMAGIGTFITADRLTNYRNNR